MTVAVEKLQKWLDAKEDEHLECKEAKTNFHFETPVKYCVALANEGGGKMILGVTDKLPRTVVGSQAFPHLERTKAGLLERLRLRVDVEEIQHPDGRVLVFQVPSRPIGMPLQYEDAYWMRGSQDLMAMTPDVLQRIVAEAGPDFSAEMYTPARLDDLDPTAVEVLRRLFRCEPDFRVTSVNHDFADLLAWAQAPS
jgi:ATP-dependent DNA helicase RecG